MRNVFATVCPWMIVLALFAGKAVADEIDVKVSPHTINLASKGAWITVHVAVPYNLVDRDHLELCVDGNPVAVAWSKADDRGDFVAKLNIQAVKDLVAPPTATFTVDGIARDGTVFFGSDTVKVVNGTKR